MAQWRKSNGCAPKSIVDRTLTSGFGRQHRGPSDGITDCFQPGKMSIQASGFLHDFSTICLRLFVALCPNFSSLNGLKYADFLIPLREGAKNWTVKNVYKQ